MREVRRIKIALINLNLGHNDIEDEALISLAKAQESQGIIQPIILRQVDDMYEVIDGQRALKAAMLNNVDAIDAIVVDDDEATNLALIAKMQRSNASAIDEAEKMAKLLNDEGITQAELAKRLGLRQSTIANKLRLLKLPGYVKQAINEGKLTERHARALLKVEEDKLEEVFNTIIERGYNVSKTEEYIKSLSVRGNRGVSNNIKIGINTIEEAYRLCKQSGLDCDLQSRESEAEVKLIIRFKK